MNRKLFCSLAVAFLMVAFGIAQAEATPVLSFNEGTGNSGTNQGQSVGWQFDVLSSITVTGLSWFDEGADGLSTSHTVGIWSPTGVLLTSVLIPNGTSATLDGQFRTVDVAPLILVVGNGYIVGGENFDANTDRLAANVTFTTNPAISFVDATFSGLGTGLQRPTNFSVATSGFFGPSFAVSDGVSVPEPASLFLLGISLIGVAALRRHSRT